MLFQTLLLLAAAATAAHGQTIDLEGTTTTAAISLPSEETGAAAGDSCATPGQVAFSGSTLFLCHGEAPSAVWRAAMTVDPCGDGVLDDGEECDEGDGNGVVCSNTCTIGEVCIDFNPTGVSTGANYVQLPTAPFQQLPSSTIEGWIYINAFPNNVVGVFETEQTRVRLGADGHLAVAARRQQSGKPYFSLSCNYFPPLDTWTHVAVTVAGSSVTDSNTAVKMFANGVELTGCTVSSAVPGSTRYLSDLLGGLAPFQTQQTGIDSTTRNYDGKMGHYVRGWSTARTASQIADNMFTQFPSGTTDLVMNYRIDEQDTPGTLVEVANNNAGTFQGATAFCTA